jgi:heat shock protein HslJ/membrane-bound inhibitor of C-type lysozyme
MVLRPLFLIPLAVVLGGCTLFGDRAASEPAPPGAQAGVQAAAAEAAGVAAAPRGAPELALDPQPPVQFRCGEQAVTLRHFGELATLQVAGRTYTLHPVRTASGAKLVSVDDERTSIWVKGDAALLELAGVAQPECSLVSERPLFRAVGNEPGWRLDVRADGLSLLLDNGDTHVFAPSPLVIDGEGMRSYEAVSAGGPLTALVFDRHCTDSMSGMPHPKTVEVRWQDRVLKGCGGDPADLLQGGPWEVVEIDGKAVADPARVTLDFAAAGRLAGIAACNRYFGSYALSGEGLRLSPLGATKMACEPGAMDEERRFIEAAGRVDGFAIAADGSLQLLAGGRVVMRGRRP